MAVVDPRENVVGHGFYSPGSAIPVRILARGEAPVVDRAFFVDRFRKALALREAFGLGGLGAPDAGSASGHAQGDLLRPTTGYRLVHAEGDGLPGLVVDRFGDALVVQFPTFGMTARENLVLEALAEGVGAKTIVDRTPAQVAKIGHRAGAGVVRGAEPTRCASPSAASLSCRSSSVRRRATTSTSATSAPASRSWPPGRACSTPTATWVFSPPPPPGVARRRS